MSAEESGLSVLKLKVELKDPEEVEQQLKGSRMLYQLLQMYRKIVLGIGRIP